MRGLSTVLRKIGFSTFAQQRNVLELLKLAGCYEEHALHENLKNAGYDDATIEKLVLLNPHLALMDEINEEEEKKVLQWLSFATKQAAQQQVDLPMNIYHEIYNVTSNILSTLNAPSHLKYDVVVILGQTQEELDTQDKSIKKFLKEKNIVAQTIFVPDKPGDTKNILTACLVSIKYQNQYAREANISNIYKACYFMAKTNRLLIISPQQNMVSDTKAIDEFFANNPSSLSAEMICLSTPLLTPKKLLEQMHLACTKVLTEKSEASSYFSSFNLFYYGSTLGSYVFNMFYHPITTGENIASARHSLLPSFKSEI